MPDWLLQFLVSQAINLIVQYGIPALEQKFPALIPLVNAILNALKPGAPQPASAVHSAAEHYNALVGALPATKGLS